MPTYLVFLVLTYLNGGGAKEEEVRPKSVKLLILQGFVIPHKILRFNNCGKSENVNKPKLRNQKSYQKPKNLNMPEGPELRLASIFVNKVAATHTFSGKITRSELATKPNHHPEVTFNVKNYSLFAESRGKELKLHLYPQNEETKLKKKSVKTVKCQEENDVKHLLFRFGMSGSFKLSSVDDIPKHAHLRFWCQDKKHVLCFVDYR